MSLIDFTEIYSRMQNERNKELTFESLTLSEHLFKGVPTLKTEEPPKNEVFGIPVHLAEWMPEGMGMATTACNCTMAERFTDKHIGKHVVILDFRTDEQKKEQAEKFKVEPE